MQGYEAIWPEWRTLEIRKRVAYILALKDAPKGINAVPKKWVEGNYKEYLPSADIVIAEVMDFAASPRGAAILEQDALNLLAMLIKHSAAKWRLDVGEATDLAKRYIEDPERVAGQVIETAAAARGRGKEGNWLRFLADLKIETDMLAENLSESGLELKAVAREL